MKKLPILIVLTAILNIGSINSQEKRYDKLQDRLALKSNDSLWIDIKIRGCYSGVWNKILITRKNEKYEFIELNNVDSIQISFDKTLILKDEWDHWITSNLDKIQIEKFKSNLTEKEYLIKMNKLIRSLKFYDKCKSDISGQFSYVEFKFRNEQFNYNFSCNIHLD